MRIAYVSVYDARDIKGWSGTGYNMAQCLERQGLRLHYIGPLRHQYSPVNIGRYLINSWVRGYNDHPQRDPGFLRHYARQVERQLRAADVDLVFGPGALPLAYLETDLPVVFWTDGTFANLLDYYPKFSNLSPRTIRDGHAADKRLLDRCDLAIFSSQWAADSAIRDYGCDPERVAVVPLGANVPEDRTAEQVERMIASRPASPIRLLFMGVDWVRKGGDVALAVARELNERGLPTELLVVGCTPPQHTTLPSYVKLLGFISKSTPEGLARINELLATSHFFILPTRADCTPIVFCEASSFGLPCLATATGGVPSVVRDSANGRVFALDASPSEYAAFVLEALAEPGRYRHLCMTTFEEYRTRLNWESAGRTVRSLLEGVLANRSARRASAARRPRQHPVSVMVLTRDEEVNIAACLECLHFSDDIVIFDSMSEDRTLEIAARHPNVSVVQRRFDNWAAHQNWAVRNIRFKHPWVLYVDADERVPSDLAEEIMSMADPRSPMAAYRVRRKDMFMGRWLRHAQLYPSWFVRLFRPERVRYERLVNPVTHVDGPVGELQGHLIHHPFSKGMSQWFERHNSYSSFEAEELLLVLGGKRRPIWGLLSPNLAERRAAAKDLFYRLPLRPHIKWLYYMLWRGAWRDGRAGLVYARLTYLYEYMISMKACELQAQGWKPGAARRAPAPVARPQQLAADGATTHATVASD